MRHITRSAQIIGSALLLAAAAGLAQAGPPSVARVFVVEVSPAQDHAFNDGIKGWEKCLREHGARRETEAYDAESGGLGRYLFIDHFSAWADMDHHDPAAKACGLLFRTAVMPYMTGLSSAISQLNAKDTYVAAGDSGPVPILWVDSYRLRPGQADSFHDALAKVAAAAAKAHWDEHFAGFDNFGAGQGGPDFVLVGANKSWADVGQDPSPSLKQLMQQTYGKSAAEANHRKFEAAIAEEWSDAWSYDKSLSYTPGR